MRSLISLFIAVSLSVCPLLAVPKGARGAQAGATMRDFTLNDISGKSYSLKDLRGKVVLLSFGASWCPYCVNEVPELNSIQAENAGNANFKLLAINLDNDVEKAKKFAEKKQIRYTLLYDNGTAVAQQYGVSGIPANFVVAPDGTAVGYGPDIDAAYAQVKKLLEQKSENNPGKKVK
jgi:peroxiredoxin